MPHFSPISWVIVGIVFYTFLIMIMSLLWWSQSYLFPKMTIMDVSDFKFKWNWM